MKRTVLIIGLAQYTVSSRDRLHGQWHTVTLGNESKVPYIKPSHNLPSSINRTIGSKYIIYIDGLFIPFLKYFP